MTPNTQDNTSGNTLVLTGPDGTVYAIPREVLEQHRATPEQIAAIEAQMTDDVSGFEMGSAYMTEKLMNYRQADLLREAEEARLARSGEEDDRVRGESTSGLQDMRHFFVGVWHNLSPTRSSTSHA